MPAVFDWLMANTYYFAVGAIGFLTTLAVAWVIKYLLLRGVRRAATFTATTLDDRLGDALDGPAMVLVFVIAFVAGLNAFGPQRLPAQIWSSVNLFILVLALAAATIGASRFILIVLRYFLSRSGSQAQVTTLTALLIRSVVAIPAVLVLLRALNIPLAPAAAALGAGGIAVGLAFKDTLANIFSGLYVSLAGTFHQGDYIKLDTGHEGYVEDIQWRMTTVRTLQNNLIMIPNAKLAEAIVTNFSFPDKKVMVAVTVGVSYGSEVEHVRRVLLESVIDAIQTVPGMLSEPEPVVRFNGFGDSSLEFRILFHVVAYDQQFAAMDAVRTRIFNRFRDEGINIPFPIRTLDIAPATLARALGNGGVAASQVSKQLNSL